MKRVQSAHLRRSTRTDYTDALRDGRRQRATTFTPAKGKGSYTRKPKHKRF